MTTFIVANRLSVAVPTLLSCFIAAVPVTARAQAAQPFEVLLYGEEEQLFAPDNTVGFRHSPDGPISFRRSNGQISMWFSATTTSTTPWAPATIMLRGPSFDALSPVKGISGTAVFLPSGSGFDKDYAGAYSVLPAANGHDLLMFYHGEDHGCNSQNHYKAGIGLARSTDGGMTWVRQGEVLTSATPAPTDCNYATQLWGVGNLSAYLSRDGQYIYMMFMEWYRPNPLRPDLPVHPDVAYLARAPASTDGAPGSWTKYNNGSFSQPGLGGIASPVIDQPPPNGNATVYVGAVSVSFNTALNRYIVLFMSLDGTHYATSADGVTWDVPRLLWPVRDIYHGLTLGEGPWVNYPTFLSPDEPSQETSGQTGYLYFARGAPFGTPPHTMSRRKLAVGVGPLSVHVAIASRRDSVSYGDAQQHADSTDVTLSGYGISNARWSARVTPGSWLALQTASGTEPTGRVRWTRDASALLPGVHVDSIAVSLEGPGSATTYVVDTLRVLEPPVNAQCAVTELLGGVTCLSDVQRRFLDLTGNKDQVYNLGDLISYLDRKQLPLPSVRSLQSLPVPPR